MNNIIITLLNQNFKMKHLFVLVFLAIIGTSRAQLELATNGSAILNTDVELTFQHVPWLDGEGQTMTFSSIELSIQEADWLDSTVHCFLTLTLFEERPVEDKPIENIAFYFEQYTESLIGVGLKCEGDETFKDPLLYRHYSDSLGDYTQALFLYDDFKVKASDSLMLNMTTIGGVPTQSQAYIFHYQQSVTMPEMNTLCKEAQATEKWLKAWLKRHPEFQDHLVRRF